MEFNQEIAELRNEGLLDWQILLLIMNIVISYRAEQKEIKPGDFITIEKELVNHVEQIDDINMPIDLLIKNMKNPFCKCLVYPATMKGWDLQLKQSTPDFNAIKRLLDIKYRNSTDDILHENYFTLK